MKFPFNTLEYDRYLSKEGKELVAAFEENEPEIGRTYKNKDKAWKVLRIFYPLGAITSKTIFVTRNDGSRNYHTPLATASGGKPLVSVVDEDGNGENMPADKWLEFVSGEFTSEKEEVEHDTEAMKRERKAVLGQRMKDEDLRKAEEFVEKTKKAKRGRKADS